MDAPIVRVVLQRHDNDCSVACLAMICGVSYENALVAMAQVQPNVCAQGVYLREMRAAAKLLGYALRSKASWDIEEDTGILNLSSRRWKVEHLVVLTHGMVIETDGLLWDADVYLHHNRATANRLYVAERD